MKIYIWQNSDLDMWYIHLDIPKHIYQLRGKTCDLFSRTEITDGYGKKATVRLNKFFQIELFYKMRLYKFNIQRDNRKGDKEDCVFQGIPLFEEII